MRYCEIMPITIITTRITIPLVKSSICAPSVFPVLCAIGIDVAKLAIEFDTRETLTEFLCILIQSRYYRSPLGVNVATLPVVSHDNCTPSLNTDATP